jgi:AraC-like DNA-binding protein
VGAPPGRGNGRAGAAGGRVLYASRDLTVVEHTGGGPPSGRAHHTHHTAAFPAAGDALWCVGSAGAGPVRTVAGPAHVVLANAPDAPVAVAAGDTPAAPPPVLVSAAPELLSRLAAWPDPGEADPDFRFPVPRAAVDACTYLLQVALALYLRHHPTAEDPLIEGLLTDLLGRVAGTALDAAYRVRRAVREPTRRDRARLADAALRLLGDVAAAEPALPELARAVGASPSHLSRVFGAETGYRLQAYRHHLRLRAALRRVADPAVPLGRIALDLGYASPSHFTDTFRRAFGRPASAARRLFDAATPAELRKNLEALLAGCPYAEGSFAPGPVPPAARTAGRPTRPRGRPPRP